MYEKTFKCQKRKLSFLVPRVPMAFEGRAVLRREKRKGILECVSDLPLSCL
jgi:hypothetical protein